jgi:hypothetical protein
MSAVGHSHITDFFMKSTVLKRASRNLQVKPQVTAMRSADLTLAYAEHVLKYFVK